jgi:hypothetical protein
MSNTAQANPILTLGQKIQMTDNRDGISKEWEVIGINRVTYTVCHRWECPKYGASSTARQLHKINWNLK